MHKQMCVYIYIYTYIYIHIYIHTYIFKLGIFPPCLQKITAGVYVDAKT